MPPVGGTGDSGRDGVNCSGSPLRLPSTFPDHATVPRLAARPINQRRSELYRRVARADSFPPVLQEAPTWTQAVPFKVGRVGKVGSQWAVGSSELYPYVPPRKSLTCTVQCQK